MAQAEHHYVLGRDDEETRRLEAQHSLWAPVTEAFLDRLQLPRGARVAELGCGPGLVLPALRQRVGEEGSVLAIDGAADWLVGIDARIEAEGWSNVKTLHGDLRELQLEEGSYDLLFSRWVFSFLPDPEEIIHRLSKALAPGGVLAIQDYNHYGVSAYPHSDGFWAIIQATRAMYASEGGDAFVAGRVPPAMAAAGLDLVDLTPNVIAGGPGTEVFQWGHDFFNSESQLDNMQKRGGLTDEDRATFKEQWPKLCEAPGAMFYSPIVLDAAGRRSNG